MKFLPKSFTSFIFLIVSAISYAQLPEPPAGKRWVINTQFSDEFNGTEIDRSKWSDNHISWKGRVPAKFDPSTISLGDGKLKIKNGLLKKADGEYTMKGGAVQSITNGAHYGYYEARFKTSRIPMSTTFWLSSFNIPIEGRNNQGENCENDFYSQELDIVEAVGGEFDKPWGKSFRNGMQFNTHIHHTHCDGKREHYSKGGNAAEGDGRIADNKLPEGQEVWQDFHTYGAWWKDANNVDFYLDGKLAGSVKVSTAVTDEPFKMPMRMQMLTETYNWATPYPTKKQFKDNTVNTSYYDWVRSYKLIDVNEDYKQTEPQLVFNGDLENGSIYNWYGWGKTGFRKITTKNTKSGKYALHLKGSGAAEQTFAAKPNTKYIMTADIKVVSGSIGVGIKQSIEKGEVISKKFGNTDYQKIEIPFETTDARGYKIYFYAQHLTDEAFIDNVELKEVNPPKYNATAGFEFKEKINLQEGSIDGDTLTGKLVYMTNRDQKATLSVLDNSKKVYETTVNLKAGYGSIVIEKKDEKLKLVKNPKIELKINGIAL